MFFIHADGHCLCYIVQCILPDKQWIMSEEEFIKHTNVSDQFKKDEQTHYTTTTTAGIVALLRIEKERWIQNVTK